MMTDEDDSPVLEAGELECRESLVVARGSSSEGTEMLYRVGHHAAECLRFKGSTLGNARFWFAFTRQDSKDYRVLFELT
jgi:hypothetical protein